jgi:predicted nucleic acid-binding protein
MTGQAWVQRVVRTRPVEHNGLGLSAPDAVANAQVIRGRIRFLAEDNRVSDQLLTLTRDVSCGGKQVHDANVVATMLVHGVEVLVTSNVADFSRFADQVQVIDLPDTPRLT